MRWGTVRARLGLVLPNRRFVTCALAVPCARCCLARLALRGFWALAWSWRAPSLGVADVFPWGRKGSAAVGFSLGRSAHRRSRPGQSLALGCFARRASWACGNAARRALSCSCWVSWVLEEKKAQCPRARLCGGGRGIPPQGFGSCCGNPCFDMRNPRYAWRAAASFVVVRW